MKKGTRDALVLGMLSGILVAVLWPRSWVGVTGAVVAGLCWLVAAERGA